MQTAQARVEIIIGCMFSGKSSELLRRCKRYRSIGMRILLVNSVHDTRCPDNSIGTHSNEFAAGMKILHLHELYSSELFQEAQVIGVDEAQFFTDLVEFVLECEKMKKTVIIAGLDGDHRRKPFGQVLDCIPLCDSVDKLVALDMVSRDGSAAIFSKRRAEYEKVDGNHLVGAESVYIATNRENYLA